MFDLGRVRPWATYAETDQYTGSNTAYTSTLRSSGDLSVCDVPLDPPLAGTALSLLAIRLQRRSRARSYTHKGPARKLKSLRLLFRPERSACLDNSHMLPFVSAERSLPCCEDLPLCQDLHQRIVPRCIFTLYAGNSIWVPHMV